MDQGQQRSSVKDASRRDSELTNAPRSQICINPIPVAVEILEDSDVNTDSGAEGRLKFEDVDREYKDDVRAAEANLQAILKMMYIPDLEMTPWEHFGMKQSCLAGVGLLSRLRHRKISCTDIRDHMENLACLVDLISQYHPRSSGYVAYLLANMCQALGKFAELLEDFSLKRVTDWTKISNHYVDLYRQTVARPKTPEIYPSVRLFNDPRLIALGEFTSTHCAKVGPNDVVIKVAFRKKRPIYRKRISHNRKLILNTTQMGCMVRHPLFARVYSAFSTDLAYLSVMEYHCGLDLDKLVATSQALPSMFAMLVVAQLCVAIEYLHYVGFIHRNIKPSNILISPMCRIKIIDCSAARVCSGIFSARFLSGFRRRTSSEFSDHESEGDLSFLAPEVIRKAAYGRAVDWWSVGVTAYQIRFGKLPFRGNTENEQKARILKGEVTFQSDPRDKQFLEYTDFVRLTLKKNPKTRMCSRGYDEYKKHELFRTLSWRNIETRTEFLSFPPISTLLEGGEVPTKTVPQDFTPDSTIITNFLNLKDTTQQHALYVFCSEPMRTLLTVPTNGASLDPMTDDFLVPFEDAPYKFRDIFKATRMF
ncbi:microtubule-associated serine/threonine-protein kinase 4-like [Galendromus occidentalis]|uniref:Serine/threonine-protein kinase greatwall n=1 Tax=Galendromus occidentalis TaxID=34638 RepID=A0AAJ7L7J3_9ACAR|nr:microtubule-associated serine/threonine-protein kinase 4-like [Galendromus occidentalis]